MKRFTGLTMALFVLLGSWGVVAHSNPTDVNSAQEELLGAVEFKGGFQELKLELPSSVFAKYLHIAIPAFCKEVEILTAHTLTEGIYDPATPLNKVENIFLVNEGTGQRIREVKLLLNGPYSTQCFIPIFASSDEGANTDLATSSIEVCNGSAVRTAFIALGFQKNHQWVTSGWWPVRRGDCPTWELSHDPNSPIYLYGTGENTSSFWGDGSAHFCVKSDQFEELPQLDCAKSKAKPFSLLPKLGENQFGVRLTN